MNKKTGIILIILLLVLLIVPIIVYADSKIEDGKFAKMENGSISIPLELSKQEIDNQIQKQKIAEKQKFEEDVKNGKVKEVEAQPIDKELKVKLELAEKEAKDKEDKIVKIISKYHEKEFKELLKQAEKEQNTKKQVDVSFGNYTVSDTEIKFYELALNVLENQNVSEEDSECLKDFLSSRYGDIINNVQLKSRFEKYLDI